MDRAGAESARRARPLRRRRDRSPGRICAQRSASGAAVLADAAAPREPRLLSPWPDHDDAAAAWRRAAEEPRSDCVLSGAGERAGLVGGSTGAGGSERAGGFVLRVPKVLEVLKVAAPQNPPRTSESAEQNPRHL